MYETEPPEGAVVSSTNATGSVAVLPATSCPVRTYPLGVDGDAVHRNELDAYTGPVDVLSPECVQPAVATSG